MHHGDQFWLAIDNEDLLELEEMRIRIESTEQPGCPTRQPGENTSWSIQSNYKAAKVTLLKSCQHERGHVEYLPLGFIMAANSLNP